MIHRAVETDLDMFVFNEEMNEAEPRQCSVFQAALKKLHNLFCFNV